MVVEDDFLLRKMLERELSRRNYITYFAQSAEEALDKLPQLSIDLILVELDLPGMNGWSFIEHQKTNALIQDIPTLIYSRAIVPRSVHGLTTRHTIKNESLEELMESIYRICTEDQGINKHAPEMRRIILPKHSSKKTG